MIRVLSKAEVREGREVGEESRKGAARPGLPCLPGRACSAKELGADLDSNPVCILEL